VIEDATVDFDIIIHANLPGSRASLRGRLGVCLFKHATRSLSHENMKFMIYVRCVVWYLINK
jgi:hypothetical protein